MIGTFKDLYSYRELLFTLIWKNVVLRYKQAYLGIAWAVIKPVMLMLIFTLVRSFVGIESGDIPYPILTFAALLPWVFFQEAASDGVGSVVNNAHLIKKIYFPREIFPLSSVITRIVDLGINLLLLFALMAWYDIVPSMALLWIPVILLYTILAALILAMAGAAVNVYYRDIGNALPLLLSLMMYVSPIIYPLQLVKEKLLVNQAAGDWSGALYQLYLLNPLAGIIDGFQNAVLRGIPPDLETLLPGMILVIVLLPLSYRAFRHAESHFADVI
jgi:lipopolysaccharide transport system permease protein